MNKLALVFSILTVMVAVGCKKDEATPVPTPQGPAPLSNMCTAQINGVSFIADGFGSSGSGSCCQFDVDFTKASKRLYFGIDHFNLQPGIYPISGGYGSDTVLSASYSDGNFFYSADTGSINITEIVFDSTAFTSIRKFVATFNFTTDTVLGNHFNVTSGSAVYINN